MAVIKKFRIKSFKKQKPIVSLKKISLSFGKRQILDNINFEANQGQILGLLGPNGVGKSTIFNLITGLIKPAYGSIFFNGVDATNYPIYERTTKFKIGFCPQYGGFFSDLTLYENLKCVGEILLKDDRIRNEKINKLISKFELDSVRDVKAKLLSGGQRKKCVIALALLGDPQILLLDEPYSALDLLTIKMLQEIIVNLQTENPKISIIICDHAARDILVVADSSIILSNGKVIAQGTPSQLMNNIAARTQYFGDSFKFN
ncbi:MAG TPA: ATP-binding cassette domain-containing protein [Candidatus Pelagibacter bacterium]|jgi:lipopolysaccharide export system ATP-binding protein|nr:sulfate transporter [Pelagibacteraceae bacterium]HJN84429.1 ATP-binding cassette domain-containing protein [Candidatus Pelagibacter bacterium]|tara:strand:- start:24 stop:803 length:780 start_codon:yes stop_codon:yes gene_type:complete